MADRAHARTLVRTAVVHRLLAETLAARSADLSAERPALAVLDAGGGTGGFAVPLAEQGLHVTVVDPSPDSLAALERRAAEAGVSGLIRGLQGDAAGLLEIVAPGSYDLVLCHSVLEVVEDPELALATLARALRPGGCVSVLAANRVAAVVGRAASGRLEDALTLARSPAGRAGPGDPLTRRFTIPELLALVSSAGLVPGPVHGIRVVADLVPGALLDDDPAVLTALLDLETELAELAPYRDLATQLHVLAYAAE